MLASILIAAAISVAAAPQLAIRDQVDVTAACTSFQVYAGCQLIAACSSTGKKGDGGQIKDTTLPLSRCLAVNSTSLGFEWREKSVPLEASGSVFAVLDITALLFFQIAFTDQTIRGFF